MLKNDLRVTDQKQHKTFIYYLQYGGINHISFLGFYNEAYRFQLRIKQYSSHNSKVTNKQQPTKYQQF